MRTTSSTQSHEPFRAAITAITVLLFAGIVGPGVEGQMITSVASGSRVRITAPSRNLSNDVGTIRESTHEALLIDFNHGRTVRSLLIERSNITTVDVSLRRERRGEKGAVIGVVVGAAIGAATAAFSNNCIRDLGVPDDCTRLVVERGILAGSVLGVGVGLIVGLLIRRDVWFSASPSRVQVRLHSQVGDRSGALQWGLSLRFR